MQTQSSTQPNKWADLLKEALSKPSLISVAYGIFYSYSVGNQILVLV